MQNLLTGYASILRGETADEYGDVADASTVAYENVPVSLVESSRVTTDPATQQPRTIRTITAVAPWWADVLNTDRFQYQASGVTYAIIEVTDQPTLGYPPDKVLKLRRVTGAGT